MMKLEEELNITLPKRIKDRIKDLEYKLDHIGLSDSIVVLFEDYTLKISKISFDIENEVGVYQALKGKLPIPEILEYEKTSEKIFLLKRKLKGKLLCDEYYLNHPNLLYSLAAKAIKLLWQVDIIGLDLQNTYDTIISFGEDIHKKGLLNINDSDRSITSKFKDFDEIFSYLKENKKNEDNCLCHGDLCLPNIICNEDEIVGFIDLGLTGISNKYHDLAILYRSIKYNMNGTYGKAYYGYDDDKLFKLLDIKKDIEMLNYYLLLDEVLG